jgi:uncharacterized protein with PIN domain
MLTQKVTVATMVPGNSVRPRRCPVCAERLLQHSERLVTSTVPEKAIEENREGIDSNGAGYWIRTSDPLRVRQMLYR